MTPNLPLPATEPQNNIGLPLSGLSAEQLSNLEVMRKNGFGRFLEPEFTDALLAHCFAAKQAALAEVEAS